MEKKFKGFNYTKKVFTLDEENLKIVSLYLIRLLSYDTLINQLSVIYYKESLQDSIRKIDSMIPDYLDRNYESLDKIYTFLEKNFNKINEMIK